jgi:hypothetical protein
VSTLSALTLVTPTIPAGLTTLSVDTGILPFTILADINTVAIDIMVGADKTTLSSPTPVNGQNQFTGAVAVTAGTAPQTVVISGNNFEGVHPEPSQYELTPAVQFNLLYASSGLSTQFGPPSGVSILRGTNACTVQWAMPTYEGFQGVRVQWSTDASGVNTPYQQYGNLVNTVSSSADTTVVTGTPTTSSTPNAASPGNLQTNTVVTTQTSTTATVEYSSVAIPSTTVNAQLFYVILTALIQDPTTNQVYESQASGPFACGFVDLSLVNPTDFLALQQAPDIASRMIQELTRRRPDLDLTARSEVRDIIINPMAIELANMSIREWFTRCSMSISAIAGIDDADGDGVSDPVASSTYKQQIAQAYGLTAASVQSFIDQRFVILGEQAGITIGGALASVVMVTFYSYNIPTSVTTIPAGTVCSTIPDTANTTATTFATTAPAVFNPSNAASYYDASNGWYAISVPAQAQSTGLATNVGAETITQILTGASSGFYVINQNAASDGRDIQSNADFAVAIRNRQVAGKDSGTRLGYWNSAMSIPGIIDALVVAAGDVDMLRDWSTVMQKHTYGCVDVYVQGNAMSQQSNPYPFSYPSPATYGAYGTYVGCTLTNASTCAFTVKNFSSLGAPIYTAVEMVATSGGRTIWLGTKNATFDNTNGIVYLSPTDQPYVINADGSTTIWQINNLNTTNLQFLKAAGASAVYSLMPQLQSGIQYTPTLQPVTGVNSISGPITGSLPATSLNLIYTTDFLLTGGSNNANDLVSVPGTLTGQLPTQSTISVNAATVTIASNIALSNIGNIVSLRSSDLSTLYVFGTDYDIVPTGRYQTYALQILPGSQITVGPNTQVIAAYYQYLLQEQATFQTDTLTLSGSTPAPLLNNGFIYNTWLPASHGSTQLLLDGQSQAGQPPTGLIGAGVAPAKRYIKVSITSGSTTTTMVENRDFTLVVNSTTGAASLTRVLGGLIPDGGTVTVNYFTNEVLTIATEYPAYVQQIVSTLAATSHAGADVLVKSMVPTPIDLVINVVLNGATTPSSVDGTIRTQIDLAIAAASEFYQSAAIEQIQGVTGVQSILLPLLKCAKADGSYDIGRIIPTGTTWLPLKSDSSFNSLTLPPNSWITEQAVLPYPTLPSGGQADSYVGFLYQGQQYRRAASVADFLNSTVPSFYIVGTSDSISTSQPLPSASYSRKILLTTPQSAANPALLPYFVSYQIFGAASADDISVASCEYLVPGAITLNYVTES